MDLPPGPSTPTAVQTLEWVARPTALMRRCAARYGDVFTVRTMWMDAPMVFVSRPDEIKRVFAARPDVMTAGASSRILEPLVGPRSILLLDGDDHMRERKQMLPPFHGEALARWQGTIAELAEAELDGWEPGSPVRALGRMQALTLEVILRVVFGGPDPELRDAIRRVLDVGGSLPRMISMVVSPPGSRPWASFDASVARLDDLLEAREGRGLLPDRDQLVTLLAAGHETTAGALAWAVERLARHPEALERIRTGDDAWLDAVVKEVLRVRPVLAIAPRKLLAPFVIGRWTLPAGVHVAPCAYLAHRRPELWPDPLAFRPERFLEGAPAPYAFVPFGGGTRRCVGAAFAALEMREVLRALAARFTLRPARAASERMRRRSVTLTPDDGGHVIPEALASPEASRCRSSAVTTA